MGIDGPGGVVDGARCERGHGWPGARWMERGEV